MFKGFCCQYLHNLDDKNRFKIPAAFREMLGTSLYLIKSPDLGTKCIYVYSESGWNELFEQFNLGEQHNEATRRKSRKILSSVVYGEVDKSGRFTLNAALKGYAGIEGEVLCVGNNKHIELWAPDEWERECGTFEDESADDLNINF